VAARNAGEPFRQYLGAMLGCVEQLAVTASSSGPRWNATGYRNAEQMRPTWI